MIENIHVFMNSKILTEYNKELPFHMCSNQYAQTDQLRGIIFKVCCKLIKILLSAQ